MKKKMKELIRWIKQPSYVYLGNSLGLVKILSKYFIYIDTRDVGLTPHLIIDGLWEIWITKFIYSVVQKGMHVVDIGANYGYYTLLMADLVGESGSVLAFEPNKHLNNMLKDSCRINGFGSITEIRAEAVSKESGRTVRFATLKNDPKNGYISSQAEEDLRRVNENYDIYEVKTVSLDSLNDRKIDFIKIDAEGAEIGIFHGMKQAVRGNKNIRILMEFNAAKYPDKWEKFFDDMLAEGFLIRFLDTDSEVKPVSKELIRSTRVDEDWMLYLKYAG